MKGLLVLGMCMMNGIPGLANQSANTATVATVGQGDSVDVINETCGSMKVGTALRGSDALNYFQDVDNATNATTR